MKISHHYLLDDLDLKNIEWQEGNRGEFSEEAKKSGTWASKHFDNINDYKLYRFFNDLDSGDNQGHTDEISLYHSLIS